MRLKSSREKIFSLIRCSLTIPLNLVNLLICDRGTEFKTGITDAGLQVRMNIQRIEPEVA